MLEVAEHVEVTELTGRLLPVPFHATREQVSALRRATTNLSLCGDLLDTADGDPVEMIYPWGPVRLLRVSWFRLFGAEQFIFAAIDPFDGTLLGWGTDTSSVYAETEAWFDVHNRLGRDITSRTGMSLSSTCPACGEMLSLVKATEFAGYARCVHCSWTEFGTVVRTEMLPLTRPWPNKAEVMTARDGNGGFIVHAIVDDRDVYGLGDTFAEAEVTAFEDWLRGVTEQDT